jgi:hypothetical protein
MWRRSFSRLVQAIGSLLCLSPRKHLEVYCKTYRAETFWKTFINLQR